MNVSFIPLSDAALAIGKSYHATLRLIHVRELDGRKTANGRWEVSRASLGRLLREQTAAAKPLGRASAMVGQ